MKIDDHEKLEKTLSLMKKSLYFIIIIDYYIEYE